MKLDFRLEEDIRSRLERFEKADALFAESAFVERTEAIDLIEVHVIDRVEAILDSQGGSTELVDLKNRAEELVRALERVNQKMFQRMQREIKHGKGRNFRERFNAYLPHSLAASDKGLLGYDVLDTFVSGVLAVADGSPADFWPEVTVNQEPEMIFYQPTPARVVGELISKAGITAKDVFYDLGSGLGQVAILVNLLTRAATKGVEIQPAYCDYARLAAQKLFLKDVEFENADARAANLAGGTVYYLYTPFTGKILKAVLKKLEGEARERAMRVCTYGPCTRVVAKEGWLEAVDPPVGGEDEIVVFKSRPIPRSLP